MDPEENSDSTQLTHDLEFRTDYNEGDPYLFKLYTFVKNIISKEVRIQCKSIFLLAWPLSLSNVLLFLFPMSTLIFLGHFERDSLAGAALALAFSTVAGLTIISGFTSACITQAAPAFSTGNKRLSGIVLQRTFVLSLIMVFPLISVWINSKPLFLAAKQDEANARTAQEFLLYYTPTLVFQTIYCVLQKFLASQNIVLPLICGSFSALILNIGLNYTLIFAIGWGTRGAALAADITWCFNSCFLLCYMLCCGILKETWPGYSNGWFLEWGKFLLLALPSSAMTFVEIAAFQYGTFLMGGVSSLELDVFVIIYYIAYIIYANAHGMATIASVKVGSALGSRDIVLLKQVIKALLLDTCFITISLSILLLMLKDVVGYLFTNDSYIIHRSSECVPLLGLFIILDGCQAVCGGILQGSGLQKHAAFINLVGYILLAIPVGSILTVVPELGAFGYWIGLTIGVAAQVALFAFIILKLDFKARSMKVRKRAGIVFEEGDDFSEMRTMSFFGSQTNDVGNGNQGPGCITQIDTGNDEFLTINDNVPLSTLFIGKRIVLIAVFLLMLPVGVVIRYVGY